MAKANEVKGATIPKGAEYQGKSDIDLLKWVVGVVVIVLLTVIGGMITTAVAQYQSSYNDLRDEVKIQNDKIDRLADLLENKYEQKTIQETN